MHTMSSSCYWSIMINIIMLYNLLLYTARIELNLLNVLRPPFCTLTTHFWLNWVDEDDWWGWGWLERKARRHLIHRKYYIKIRPEALGVRTMDLIPNFAIIGNCWLWKVQVGHAWRRLAGWGVKNPAQVAPTTRS